MASPLHDRKKPAAAAAEEKKPEAKPAEGGDGGGEKKADAKPKGEEVVSAWQSMVTAHEGERRDAHNAYRESMRAMAKRHEKQMREFYGRNPEGEPVQPETTGAEMAEA